MGLAVASLGVTSAVLVSAVQDTSPVGGAHLDHVSLAVADLEAATDHYRLLGFAVRPGRHHPNGIVNAFITFDDGSEVELITASEAKDSLSQWYLDWLERREGPAYVALRTDDAARVARALDARGVDVLDSGPESRGFRTVVLDVDEPLRRIFFIEYLAGDPDSAAPHLNSATGVRSVWFAVADIGKHTRDLERLGFRPASVVPFQQINGLGRTFPLASGQLVLVAPTNVAGHTAEFILGWDDSIMGVTIEVADVDRAAQAIRRGTGRQYRAQRVPGRGRSLLLPPGLTHGLWLELLEPEPATR